MQVDRQLFEYHPVQMKHKLISREHATKVWVLHATVRDTTKVTTND